jgi:hypothetical protein
VGKYLKALGSISSTTGREKKIKEIIFLMGI